MGPVTYSQIMLMRPQSGHLAPSSRPFGGRGRELGNSNEVCVQMPTACSISPFILVTALFSPLGQRLAQ